MKPYKLSNNRAALCRFEQRLMVDRQLVYVQSDPFTSGIPVVATYMDGKLSYDTHPLLLGRADDCLQKMIRRYTNHLFILFCRLGNEILNVRFLLWTGEVVQSYLSRMSALAKQLDPHRYATQVQ